MCARLTIPHLLPEVGFTQDSELPCPYSGEGARGTVRLASRIVSALYPLSGDPLFGLELDEVQVPQGASTSAINQILAMIERHTMDELNTTNLRESLTLAVQHLIVIGDCLLRQGEDNEFQIYRLDQYVVQRRPNGKVQTVILQEWVDPDDLPEELEGVKDSSSTGSIYRVGGHPYEPYYTRMTRDGDKWKIESEFRGTVVHTETVDLPPFDALRWTAVVNEDYGRSLCEENIGDLRSEEAVSRSLIEGAAANAEFRFLVSPYGVTEIDDLKQSENGDWIPGVESDVHALQLGSQVQLQTAMAAKELFTRALGYTFLVDSVIQPTGERVTATQARIFANELEHGLGGVFSSVAREIVIPIVRRTLNNLAKARRIPSSLLTHLGPGGIIKIRVRTGLEALKREVELAKQIAVAETLRALVPQERLDEEMNWSGFIQAIFINAGLNTKNLLLTEEEKTQRQQAQQSQALGAYAAQTAIDTGGKVVETSARASADASRRQA